MSTSDHRRAPIGTTDPAPGQQQTWFDQPLFCTRCEGPLQAGAAFVCDGCYAELQAEAAASSWRT